MTLVLHPYLGMWLDGPTRLSNVRSVIIERGIVYTRTGKPPMLIGYPNVARVDVVTDEHEKGMR